MAMLVGVMGLVTIWLLATPFVDAVATTTMRRFHLRSSNFWTWAPQFPVPAMYNFANRYRVDWIVPADEPGQEIGLIDAVEDSEVARPFDLDKIEFEDTSEETFKEVRPWRYANHFPTRVITFADGRFNYMRNKRSFRFEIESRYQDHVLRSVYDLRYRDNASYQMRLLESDPAGERAR